MLSICMNQTLQQINLIMLSCMLAVEDIQDSGAFQIVQDVNMNSVKDVT